MPQILGFHPRLYKTRLGVCVSLFSQNRNNARRGDKKNKGQIKKYVYQMEMQLCYGKIASQTRNLNIKGKTC